MYGEFSVEYRSQIRADICKRVFINHRERSGAVYYNNMAEIVLHKILNFNIEFPAKINETGINISIRNFLINGVDNQSAVSLVSLLF